MMRTSHREHLIHRIFFWSVVAKAADAFLETAAGIALIFTGTLANFALSLIQSEIVEDPHDMLAQHLAHLVPQLAAQASVFAVIYLISHGVIKLFLAIGLLKDWLWAYPTAIVVFTFFIAYQLFRYLHTHGLFLLLLTVLDLIVIWLTWHEWRYYEKHRAFPR